jgi:hypothetical protein
MSREPPLLSQAEYAVKCLNLCTGSAWLSKYDESSTAQRVDMLKNLNTHLNNHIAVTATRTDDLMQFVKAGRPPHSYWSELSSRGRLTYLNEVKSLEILEKKEEERKRVFDRTPYLLTDEESEEWQQFCILKETYTHKSTLSLKTAIESVRALQDLCLESGIPLDTFGELKRNLKKRKQPQSEVDDSRSTSTLACSVKAKPRARSRRQARKGKHLQRQQVQDSGFKCGFFCGALVAAIGIFILQYLWR